MIAALLTIHLLTGAAPADVRKLEPVGVDYRVAVAGATAAPWVTANGWRFLRTPDAKFISEATGPALSLAMAEAFAWRGNVWFQVADADRAAFDTTLTFLQGLAPLNASPTVQVAVKDDGSAESGEVLKLLVRRNLVAGPLAKNAPAPAVTVELGTPEYPREAAQNPAAFAAGVRARLGDEKRLLRIYGSDVVIGHLEEGAGLTRIHLLNYSNRDVSGARVRVLGRFQLRGYHALNQPDSALQDFAAMGGATEFTVPKLTRYAVVDLAADVPVLESKKVARDFKLTADPNARQWRGIAAAQATRNYLGEAVPLAASEIRSRWTANNLYLLFSCPYEELNLKPNPMVTAETARLWTWDVAEAFLGSDAEHIERYREFQVSPQGEWVDLEIDRAHPKPDGGAGWNSGFTVKARVDAAHKIWYGEMRIPLSAFTPAVGKELRAGFFRLQGAGASKKYIAWQPTGERNFHVPQAFGVLRLVE
jgi:hypothetical protein